MSLKFKTFEQKKRCFNPLQGFEIIAILIQIARINAGHRVSIPHKVLN